MFAAAVIHEKEYFDVRMVPLNSMGLVILSNKVLQGSVADFLPKDCLSFRTETLSS